MSAKPINTIALRTSCVLKIHLQPLTGSLPVAAAIPSKAGIEESPAKQLTAVCAWDRYLLGRTSEAVANIIPDIPAAQPDKVWAKIKTFI